jgi:hypothetical protein
MKPGPIDAVNLGARSRNDRVAARSEQLVAPEREGILLTCQLDSMLSKIAAPGCGK